jgi:hypothetical protein
LTGEKNSIASNGNLVLQPADPSQNIIIEGSSDTEALNLTAAELNTFRNGFASITIGRSDGSGAISIASGTPNSTPVAVTFQDPTTIQSPNGTGAIVGTRAIVGTDNATIALFGGTVTVGDVTSKAGINITSSQGNVTAGTVSSRSASGAAGPINIRSAGSVQTRNIDAFGSRSGGDISIAAPGQIVTGVINSSSEFGSAGSSKITGQKDVEVVSIKARGNTGGDVEIEAGGAFRTPRTGTAPERAEVSISTDGLARSGSQTLQQSTCSSGTCTATTVGTVDSKPNTATSSTAIGPLAIVPSPAPTSSVALQTTATSQQIVTQVSLVGLRVGAKEQ